MNVLAWPIVLIGLVCMFPWARWLLGVQRDRVLTAAVTLALSAGALSLAMLWCGLLFKRVDWRIAGLICAAISAIGFVFLRPQAANSETRSGSVDGWSRWIGVGVLGIAALIVMNAAYWPISIDDAVAIYAFYGKSIAQSGQLPAGTLYEAYPMAVPLLYAFSHQAAGWIDEGLAALITALLAVGTLASAYALGRTLYNRSAGLGAAFLIACTPMVAHWASSGYVDLPAGFFYGLAVVFVARLTQTESPSWRDALLAGIMAGLAAWIKNSALLIVPMLGQWWLYWLWRARPSARVAIMIALLIGIGFLATAGPWYVRNLLIAQLIVPPTGWTWLAARTLPNLFPYLIDTRYLWPGLIFTAGILYALFEAIRSRGADRPSAILLIFYVPFFGVWWLLVSYDVRFLLTLTPLIAVMGSRLVIVGAQAIQRRFLSARQIKPIHKGIALIGLAILALPALWTTVDFKAEFLRTPFPSLEARYRIAVGPRYDVGQFLSTLPAGSRIWATDLLLPYRVDNVGVTVSVSPEAGQLAGFDYLVLSPGEGLPEAYPSPGTLVYELGGYRVYRLR